MNGINPSTNGPGLLADHLAELLRRFRHFSGTLHPGPSVAPHLARIRISARLLGSLGAAAAAPAEGFVRLSRVLGEWTACFESSTESFPVHLVRPMERLADYLEEVLAQRDRGMPVAELATAEGWFALLGFFRQAGTPLAVMEEVDDLFRKWGGRWTEENLTPAQEQQLDRRWREVRSTGDLLFSASSDRRAIFPDGPDEGGIGSAAILLLVDSSFRRDQIRDKLADRGFTVEIPGDVAAALELVVAGPKPQAILCDHLEPTRHLARVREGLTGLPGASRIPLILITSLPRAPGAELDRARALGAQAAWPEPFRTSDLKRILQRLSQP